MIVIEEKSFTPELQFVNTLGSPTSSLENADRLLHKASDSELIHRQIIAGADRPVSDNYKYGDRIAPQFVSLNHDPKQDTSNTCLHNRSCSVDIPNFV
jgi:hypothetical protein